MRVRTLKERGINRFRDWLQAGAKNGAPTALLTDAATSEPLPGAGDVEDRAFGSRYDLAVHVLESLEGCDFSRISYHSGLWSWLTLFYIDRLLPADRAGRRKVQEMARYLLLPEYRQYFRHLAHGAVMLVRRSGVCARALLTARGGVHVISSVYDQLASRQELISNPAVVELVWRLYYNRRRNSVRPGAAGTKRPGGIRRFAVVLQQLSLNYDLPAMKAREIADLLPREFDGWKRNADWAAPVDRDTGSCRRGEPRVSLERIPVGSEWGRSRLAELWGYSHAQSLRAVVLAPREFDGLLVFLTNPASVSPGAAAWPGEPRRLTCPAEGGPAVGRRIAQAAQKRADVHVFHRSASREKFTYLGNAQAQPVTAPGRWTFVFRN